MAYLVVYHSLERLRNTTTNLNDDNLQPDDNSSWVPPKCMSGALPLHKSARFMNFIFQL
jgi:hypothetical protein